MTGTAPQIAPPDASGDSAGDPSSRRLAGLRWAGLVAGPVAAAVLYVIVPDTEITRGDAGGGTVVAFGPAGRATLALMVWMGVWWLTEAVSISITALLPVAVLPLMTVGELGSARAAMMAATAPYADPLIALFMGGFLLALSMERWGLHRRIALIAVRLVGTKPANMIAGFMAITAIMSMWVSNTATTVTMLPIAMSVIGLLAVRSETSRHRGNFQVCLLLGIAYAASVGGIGTLIGTPPNLILAGFIKAEYDYEISFARWLGVGLPLVVVFVPLIWVLLTRVIYPVSSTPIEGGRALIRAEYERLGPVQRGEWITFVVFMLTALGWIFRPLLVKVVPGLTDAGIVTIAALVLFVVPVDVSRRTFVMNWEWAKKLPWGILILFGGGLSLAAAVSAHGVADFIGSQARWLGTLPSVVVVMAVATGVIFLTELTSNTATTATLLPILAGLAPTLGLDPYMVLVPATIAASCAFMMPVATPPNAIVFGAGHVTIPQMCRAGLWLNLIGVMLVTILAYAVVAPLLVGPR